MKQPGTTIKLKKPKTTGLEWLQYSFTAFNGSGYANYDSPEEFVESYIAYKGWKNKQDAVKLAKENYGYLLTIADYLIANSDGAGILPSEKQMQKFQRYLESTQA